MMADLPLALIAAWLALAAGAGLLPGERERRLSGAGLLTLGLGLAAWGAGSPAGLALIPPSHLGEGFLVVNGGLLLLGAILLVVAAVRGRPSPLRPLARVVTGLGAALLWLSCAGFVAAAGPLRAFGAAVALGIAGAGLIAGGRVLASSSWISGLCGRVFTPPVEPMRLARGPDRSPPIIALVVLFAATAMVAFGPHLSLVFGGVVAGSWGARLAAHPPHARPVPFAPVLTLVLVPAYWLLATIAGPIGLRRDTIPQIPVSPAAELIVAGLLVLAAWATAGLWPLHRQLAGALAAPLGALLLAAVGLPLVAGGLEYWRPLAVPLLMVGLWHAAAHARWPLLAGGAGVLGPAGATAAGVNGALWLLATGFALELLASRPLPERLTPLLRPAAWLAGSWGGLRVLEGGLRGEVVYSALGTAGLALIIASCQPRAELKAGASQAR